MKSYIPTESKYTPRHDHRDVHVIVFKQYKTPTTGKNTGAFYAQQKKKKQEACQG